MRFRGIYAPLVTPFDHRGNIYWSKVEHNVGQLLRTKLSGFLVCDRWGEGPLLFDSERAEIWTRVATLAGADVQVLAAISGCGVAQAREAVAAAAAAGCACAVLDAPDVGSMAPQADAGELFFRAVADKSALPVVVEARLGGTAGVTAQRLAALAAHPAIVGALVEGGTEQEIETAAAMCGPDFSILVRDLGATVPGLSNGARAAVLAIAAALPFYALSIEEAIRTREQDAAADLVARALELDTLLHTHGVPALKCALDLRSCYGGIPRLPLPAASPATVAAVSGALRELAS
ncbi:MAG: dihydrodipicolinate synthase family protein [Bryobacterales bacterium]|nr:dihydrodipicolinate synthase family protein [Bryobacterales bacterium]MDE0624099.1 dihydrodipicolinate synthase family protein [Bryobacterales bacterium]